ncbi:spore germination protein [Paenibacillus sp. WQ 127069]|uniref:Spore germination protein n=1 Tax=Paenibacillus baimaensis TaxID=2982185 RepID=A0ABT2UD20_9BACL|nr:spore germination protein [Paenibacillus sp. WQ 127069]MCU6791817.1 spore germination protein [Paenibacillus sp. WQ 127069]
MFEKQKNFFKLLKIAKSRQHSPPQQSNVEDDLKYTIDVKLDHNLSVLKGFLSKGEDVIFREFRLGDKNKTKAFICWIDGLADQEYINTSIIKPLMRNIQIVEKQEGEIQTANLLKVVEEQIISASSLKEVTSMDEVLGAVLSGQTVLFIDGFSTVLNIASVGFISRAVTEPETETVVRGPKEGFTESILTNTSLIRRKIKNPKLVFKSYILGKQTHTTVCISYIDGIANPNVVEEVISRLKRIETDAILESGYIEQYIEDHPLSLFSTIGNSEKVDAVAGKMLEGRVAILCDGTPFVLTVPRLFIENFQISEDYYTRPYAATFLRWIRMLSFPFSLITPAAYVAVETYHQEMLPTILLTSMAASREGIPFPAVIESLMMVIVFEILRESGVRLPRAVGQAVSIVGALVIGQAAVQAGLVSAPMVIVVALTGITSFIVSPLYDFIIIARLALIILSSILGFYGVGVGLMFMIAHLCSLSSFGTPFLAPFTPLIWSDLKDTFIRLPLWLMRTRPASIGSGNRTRYIAPDMPKPENEGEQK